MKCRQNIAHMGDVIKFFLVDTPYFGYFFTL
nr:MAG TPA: hypothetical protein [Caudoviricetes sp.]